MKGRPPEQSTSPPRRRVSSTPRIGRGRSGEKSRPDMACERVDCQQRACMVCGRGRCTESASCRGGPSCGLHGIGSAGSKAPGDLGTGRTAGAYTTLGTTSASIAGSTPAWCVGGEARRERAVPRRPKLWTTGAEALAHLAAGRYARKAALQGSPALMAPPRLARSGGARRLRTLCTICSRWRSRGASGGGCRSTRFRGADSVSVRLRGSARTIYHTLGPGATQGTHRPAAGCACTPGAKTPGGLPPSHVGVKSLPTC